MIIIKIIKIIIYDDLCLKNGSYFCKVVLQTYTYSLTYYTKYNNITTDKFIIRKNYSKPNPK